MNTVFVQLGQMKFECVCVRGRMLASTCMLVRAYISMDKWGQADGMLSLGPHVPQPEHAFLWPFTSIWLPFFRFHELLWEVWSNCIGHITVLCIDNDALLFLRMFLPFLLTSEFLWVTAFENKISSYSCRNVLRACIFPFIFLRKSFLDSSWNTEKVDTAT